MEEGNNNYIKNILNEDKGAQYFLYFLICCSVLSVILFTLSILGIQNIQKNNQSKQVKQNIQNTFENVSLTGKSIFVFDVVNQRELFSKNADEPLPLASLTKVMTALTIEKVVNQKKNQNIKIKGDHLLADGDSGLLVGDTWNANDLRDFMLLTSSNDGATAVTSLLKDEYSADYSDEQLKTLFVNEMNKIAESLNMSNTKFFNEHGLDREIEKGGAYGSARDMSVLFEYILKNYPETLEATRYKHLDFVSNEARYGAENTNDYVNKIPSLIASKTGFTDLAGGNLAIAFDAGLNRPIIIVVLGSTRESRFDDTLKLVDASIEYITQNQ